MLPKKVMRAAEIIKEYSEQQPRLNAVVLLGLCPMIVGQYGEGVSLIDIARDVETFGTVIRQREEKRRAKQVKTEPTQSLRQQIGRKRKMPK